MKNIISALAFILFAKPAIGLDNQLTQAEVSDGWQLLFNGENTSHWRNFKKTTLNSNWMVKDNVLQLNGEGGDILTKRSFKNFELKLQWKIAKAGNSGIFILVDESGPEIYSHAPEVQILDNKRHSDNKVDSHLSGSLYDLVASPVESHKPAGEWNRVRILLNQLALKVWQNDVVTVDIQIGSERWRRLVAQSKFATWKGFGINQSGHIGLQDHGDEVAFKNIKIKEL